jgi:hypothetical protein
MARNLANQTNVQAPSADYPNGRIKDDTGANDGTPVDESTYGDIHQLMMKFLRAASITPNNLPENESNGYQLFDAFYDLAVRNPLAFNGWFNDDSIFEGVTGANGLHSGVAANKDFIYVSHNSATAGAGAILKIDRSDYSVLALSSLGSLQAADLFVDDTYIYALISGTGLRVFQLSDGAAVPAKSINLAATLKGLVIYDGHIYIGNNTAGQIEVYNQSTLAQESPLGASLNNITSLEAKYGRVYASDNTGGDHLIKVFLISTGLELPAEEITLSATVRRVKVYGGRVYVMNGDGSNRDMTVYSSIVDGGGGNRVEDTSRSINLSDDLTDFEINQNQIIALNTTLARIYLHDQNWEL